MKKFNIKTGGGGYKTFDARCDVFDSKGKTCGEPVEPSINWDCSSSSDDGFKWRYYPRYHTSWSCKKHGAVPISINGIPCCLTPEEVIGEFEQIKKARQDAKSGKGETQ